MEEDFETFMADQIKQIRSYRKELERNLNRDVSVDEAARRWIQEYADQFRHKYETTQAS